MLAFVLLACFLSYHYKYILALRKGGKAGSLLTLKFLPDVDECAVENGGCHHSCHNTAGSFECRCGSGYSLASDGKTCNGEDAPSVCTFNKN